MKRALFATLVMILSFQQMAFPQSLEWCEESGERIEKMQNLDLPEDCGVDIIDNAAKTCKEIADVTIRISPIIKNFYITYFDLEDNAENKSASPSIDELYGLGKEVTQLAGKLAELTTSLTNITDIVKSMTAREALSSSSNVKYITQSLPSIGKELYLDFQLLGEMIKDKTGNSELLGQLDQIFSWL